MSFTDEEVAYLRSQPLARVSTVSADGQPDVVPLAFELDGDHIWIGGSGAAVWRTRKFRNIATGNRKIALVVDDLVSLDPFIARGVRVYGLADEPVERVGLVGPGVYARITPIHSGAGTSRASHDNHSNAGSTVALQPKGRPSMLSSFRASMGARDERSST